MDGRKVIVELAVRDTLQGNLSQRAAAALYGTSPRTLPRHRDNPFQACRMGRPTHFSPLEEAALEEIVLLPSGFQIGMARSQFLAVVQECAIAKGIRASRLGRRWFERFCKRHPKVSERVTHAQNIKKLKEWTTENADCWIEQLRSLQEDGYLSDPEGIFNFDESGFKLACLHSTTLAKKGAQYVHSLAVGNDRDQITTLFCGNATGKMLRPLILFQGLTWPKRWFEDLADDVVVGVNSSGIMDFENLVGYFKKEIVPIAEKRAKTVVFFDGHYSHIYNSELLKLCIQNRIRLVCFPAGQTARLQPLDKSVFGGLKKNYNYVRKISVDLCDPITKESFPRHLSSVCKTARFKENLASGFRKTGIFPFSPEVIHETVFRMPELPAVKMIDVAKRKTRVLKNDQLRFDAGKIIDTPDYLEAILQRDRDREEKKKAKLKPKKKQIKKPSKRSAAKKK